MYQHYLAVTISTAILIYKQWSVGQLRVNIIVHEILSNVEILLCCLRVIHGLFTRFLTSAFTHLISKLLM